MATNAKWHQWRLRLDIAWTRAFIWVADPMRNQQLNPEVHLYLADRYGRLAKWYDRAGCRAKARLYDDLAEYHFRTGGGLEPPPAVAAVMPVPKPPLFTRAVAERRTPDDAA
jgi:hypothetical protein